MKQLKSVLLFTGWFNIISSIGFVVPVLSHYIMVILNQVNAYFNWGGQMFAYQSNTVQQMMLNLGGAFLVLIGIIALLAARSLPTRKDLVFLNGACKIFFVVIASYYVFELGMMRVFLVFVLMDVCIVLLYWYLLRRAKSYFIIGS